MCICISLYIYIYKKKILPLDFSITEYTISRYHWVLLQLSFRQMVDDQRNRVSVLCLECKSKYNRRAAFADFSSKYLIPK